MQYGLNWETNSTTMGDIKIADLTGDTIISEGVTYIPPTPIPPTPRKFESDRILVGDEFICIKDVVMEDGPISYIKGKRYISHNTDCITDEQGDVRHYWVEDNKFVYDFKEHFKPIENVHKCPDKRQFDTGAVRDSNEGKPLIHTLLGYTRQRFGYHMAKNAKKYGAFNFLKGIPSDAYLESVDRHLAAYMAGDRSEDHLASILFGIQGLMLNEEKDGTLANHYMK